MKPKTHGGAAVKQSSFRRLLKLRRAIRCNLHIGITIKRSDYGLGWLIGHISTQWTLLTIYIDANGGYTLFKAIPDINRGVDVEDEKLLIHTDSLWLLMCRFNAQWFEFFYGPATTRTRDTWEGKMMQDFGENFVDVEQTQGSFNRTV